MKVFSLFAVVLLIGFTQQYKLLEDDFYYGGVAEVAFATNGTPQQNLEANLKTYLRLLEIPSTVRPDILVFPESTLNSVDIPTFVPDPRHQVLLCNNEKATIEYESFLEKLSCEAKRLATYLVINLTEKQECDMQDIAEGLCAPNGLNIYNTNVVFDRDGVVVSRYRKVHLYGEKKNTTRQPEFGRFDTDFGVTFGHFICFDILFYTPVQELVLDEKITDFLYPTMWFSQLPFLTGVQFQSSWSFGNNVNLLAAGSSLPSIGTTGTGIYHGRDGALFSHTSIKEGESLLQIMKVPKYKTSANKRQKRSLNDNELKPLREAREFVAITQDDIFLKRDYLENYETKALDFSNGSKQMHHMCYNGTDFCCHFELEWQGLDVPLDSKYYKYRLGIYKGWRNEVAVEMNKIANCALFTCIGDELKDCGRIFPGSEASRIQNNIRFKRILISVLYPQSSEYLLMPNSLLDDLSSLPVSKFEWQSNEVEVEGIKKQNVSLELTKETEGLLTFAIYGNYYNGTETGRGAAASLIVSMLLMLFGLVFSQLCN